MTHVLIIEPDVSVRVRLEHALGGVGHRVTTAGCGRDGVRAVRLQRPDVVVLDLDLEDLDGLDVLRKLHRTCTAPVIAAVPAHDERRAVTALRTGADDCVGKPFKLAMLSARVDALARRYRVEPAIPVLKVGDLTVDVAAHQARLDGHPLRLRPREFELLAYLASHQGRIVTKRELAREIWQSTFGCMRTVDVHLSLLRRRLGESAAQPRYLHSLRGVGVKLHAPTA
ncbi:response regulator transcription factor [Streptomyces sp. NPDC001594]|uniref:response regulator transcription factor n=1 Tax=Streptomyces sp. NPDC001594 TaxID=3364590 RepID=UPI0036AFD16C